MTFAHIVSFKFLVNKRCCTPNSSSKWITFFQVSKDVRTKVSFLFFFFFFWWEGTKKKAFFSYHFLRNVQMVLQSIETNRARLKRAILCGRGESLSIFHCFQSYLLQNILELHPPRLRQCHLCCTVYVPKTIDCGLQQKVMTLTLCAIIFLSFADSSLILHNNPHVNQDILKQNFFENFPAPFLFVLTAVEFFPVCCNVKF